MISRIIQTEVNRGTFKIVTLRCKQSDVIGLSTCKEQGKLNQQWYKDRWKSACKRLDPIESRQLIPLNKRSVLRGQCSDTNQNKDMLVFYTDTES